MTAEPSVDLDAAATAAPLDGWVAGFRRWSAATLVGLLWFAALLITWRRLAGTISVPLQPVLLVSVGGLVGIVAAAVRRVRRHLPAESGSGPTHWLAPLLATGAVLALGAAVSLPATDPRGLVVFWAMLVGEELWAWRPARWRRQPGRRKTQPSSPPAEVGTLQGRAADRPPAALTGGRPADHVLQQLTRSQAADGGEQLSGWLRAPFAAGQRTAAVHLAFCPQFAETPELTVGQLDGPEVLRINKAVFSFGARLDLKLAAPAAEPLALLLQVSARSKPPAPPTTMRRSTF